MPPYLGDDAADGFAAADETRRTRHAAFLAPLPNVVQGQPHNVVQVRALLTGK